LAAIAPVKVEAPVTPSVPLAVTLVNAPAAGVVPPIEPLSEPLVLVSEVNAPVDGVVAPTVVPLIEPPVIATAFAFWVDIVPKPVMFVFGIVVLAVMALVPLPYT